MALFQLAVLQALCPMRITDFLSMLPLYVSMFLLYCLFANLISIYAPVYMAAGSLKPSNPKLSTVLLQLVMFLFFFPLTQLPAFVPMGIEGLLGLIGWGGGVPIALLLSLAECAVVVLLYRLLLNGQGRLFQSREQAILEVVTNRAA
jgi:hypothetical protein